MCSIMGFSSKALTQEELRVYFDRTLSRGPDMSRIVETKSGYLCFHRLAIMGLNKAGMQPFELEGIAWSATARFTGSALSAAN